MSLNNKRFKELLREVELDENDPKNVEVLQTLGESPDVFSIAEPPSGYEQRLLSALSLKAEPELQRRTKAARSKQLRKSRSPKGENFAYRFMAFFQLPQVSWSVTAGMAVFLAVFMWSGPVSQDSGSKADLLAQTAAQSDSDTVNDWLLSMGARGTLGADVSGDDLQALADDLGRTGNQRLVDEALSKVAQQMGVEL